MNKAMAAALILLLLQLTAVCYCTHAVLSTKQQNDAVQEVHESMCKEETCFISPNNFHQLQKFIRSNQVIRLNGEKISVADRSGFIVIENVSNLTISGGESGSLIECSQHSTFGFYLQNATNITLTGFRIRNCGCDIPDNLVKYYYNTKLKSNTKVTFLIEFPKSLKLSRIEIHHSPDKKSYPEYALILLGLSNDEKSSEVPFFLMDNVYPNLTLTDCKISHSQIFTYGKTSLLIERSVVANNSKGLMSYFVEIEMRNVDVINFQIELELGYLMVREKLVMKHSKMYVIAQNVYIHDSRALFFKSTLGISSYSQLVAKNSLVVFRNCAVTALTDQSSIETTNSNITFMEFGGEIFILNDSKMDMNNRSSLVFTRNSIKGDYGIRIINHSKWKMEWDCDFKVTLNVGLSIFLSSSSAFLNGSVVMANNSADSGRLINVKNSKLEFHGSLQVIGGNGIGAFISDIVFTGRAIFSDNHAINGGAVSLDASSMYISPTASVSFTRNHAQEFGGAIYITRPKENYVCETKGASCSIKLLENNIMGFCPSSFPITFSENKAGIAGNAIYGGYTSACMPSDYCYTNCNPLSLDASVLYQYEGTNDSSDLSHFTSDPTRVCFCEKGIPDCYKAVSNITVHPGEQFNLSLAIVGYGLGTVPGTVIARGYEDRVSVSEESLFGSGLQRSQEIRETVCKDVGYSIVSERDREQISLAVSLKSLVMSLKEAKDAVDYVVQEDEFYDPIFSFMDLSGFDRFFNVPVFMEVNLLPCPVGFQLVRGKCVCHKILRDNNIETCFFSNGTALILRPPPYWIGVHNDTNTSIIINPYCPFDYCQSENINISAESPNTQCQYHRSGVLCGSCREGLSVILGSSECKTCSNLYLISIIVFILMGVALVTVVTLLNMTVSVGTLNGLILFANILQADQITILPQTTYHTRPLIAFLNAFIAWLNLDLGIPMCFFDGLTTYAKTWLQFVFPLYILALVGALIISSNYSTRVTRLLGTNTVSVLATLILLSYTKILRILITAVSFTTLTGSEGYHSVVWLADGNIQYFETKHALLFVVALLVLLLFGVPYTVTLTAAPWIQRSRFKHVSSLYNRFKPLFDAYMGPYKDSHRYWTGMLLLVRVVLIVLFSSIANTDTVAGPQLNHLLLNLSSCALLTLITALMRPYKKALMNGLEIFYFTILLILSFSNLYILYISTGIGPHTYIYIYTVLVGICFLVFLGICVGHVWYRVRKHRTRRRQEPPPEREEEMERYPLWRRARVRAEDEDEEREGVTISTAGDPETLSYGERRESLVELIADSADPL